MVAARVDRRNPKVEKRERKLKGRKVKKEWLRGQEEMEFAPVVLRMWCASVSGGRRYGVSGPFLSTSFEAGNFRLPKIDPDGVSFLNLEM